MYYVLAIFSSDSETKGSDIDIFGVQIHHQRLLIIILKYFKILLSEKNHLCSLYFSDFNIQESRLITINH